MKMNTDKSFKEFSWKDEQSKKAVTRRGCAVKTGCLNGLN